MVAVGLSRLIVITGTPGVGKTTISRILAARLHWKHIDCGRLAVREGLTIRYDRTAQTHLVDTDRLSRVIGNTIRELESDVILDGHLIPSTRGFLPSRVFVLRCHPRQLISRLRRKGYSRNKISENISAEILDACLGEAVKSFGLKRICEIDTTEKIPLQVTSTILEIFNREVKCTHAHVDWISRLESEGKLQEILSYVESGIGATAKRMGA